MRGIDLDFSEKNLQIELIENNNSVIGPNGKEYSSKEECDKALFESIEEAFQEMFQGRRGIAVDEFQKRSQEAYQKMDLTEYAKAQNLDDVLSLIKDFLLIRSEIPEIQKNDTIFVGGCGDGRLLDAFIVLSKLTGIKKIILNDINDYYLGVAKEKVKKIGEYKEIDSNNVKIDGINIEFLLGDLKNVTPSKEDHIITFFSLYYVTSEFGDPSSAEAMTKHRKTVGENINKLLAPNGIWIEETPDTDRSGLFRTIREMTSKVFEKAGVLTEPDKNGDYPYKHFSLANWKFMDNQDKEIAQLRVTPSNGFVSKEKEKVGFEQVTSNSRSVPIGSKHRENFAIEMIQDCEGISCLEETVKNISTLVGNVIKYPSDADPYVKRTKESIWRKGK